MEWTLAVVCALMCFGLSTEDQSTISAQDPVLVALANETLHLSFNVIVPKNQSDDKFSCFHANSKKQVHTGTDFISESRIVSWKFTVSNRSDSGEYYCAFKGEKAYWNVLVREVGYRTERIEQSEAGFILSVALSVGLFIFSSIGSAVLLKDYRKQRELRYEGERQAEAYPEEEEVTEGGYDATEDSAYTALVHPTSSVYDVLEPSAKGRNQSCAEQEVMNEPSVTYNSRTEHGIFESVYENF
ncbi:hypothetical protein GJAV_G00143700 [Gymnothorax javanicus]|nr:hypothetical protein GJAV_G00143700 [Gymnothorax javanicus]